MNKNREYYETFKNNCFVTSLANLLIEFDEEELAEKAYRNYDNHPLTLPGRGVHIGIWTRLVFELTEGKYGGLLFTNFDELLEQSIKDAYKDKSQQVIGIINKEIAKKRIRALNNHKYNPPVILGISQCSLSPPHEIFEHCVVDVGNGNYISGENYLSDEPGPLPLRIISVNAVLELKKSKIQDT